MNVAALKNEATIARISLAVLLTALVLILLLSGCYAPEAARRNPDTETAMTLYEMVCRNPGVQCYGGSVMVRGRPPIYWTLDGLRTSWSLLGSVNVRDVKSVNVCRSTSCTAKYPMTGGRAVIEIETKKR